MLVDTEKMIVSPVELSESEVEIKQETREATEKDAVILVKDTKNVRGQFFRNLAALKSNKESETGGHEVFLRVAGKTKLLGLYTLDNLMLIASLCKTHSKDEIELINFEVFGEDRVLVLRGLLD